MNDVFIPMRVRRLSKEQKLKIIKMLGHGIPCRTIAARMGVSLQTVYYTGWRLGIKGRGGQKEESQRNTQVIKELKQGITCKKIAANLGISLQMVYRIKWKEQEINT